MKKGLQERRKSTETRDSRLLESVRGKNRKVKRRKIILESKKVRPTISAGRAVSIRNAFWAHYKKLTESDLIIEMNFELGECWGNYRNVGIF